MIINRGGDTMASVTAANKSWQDQYPDSETNQNVHPAQTKDLSPEQIRIIRDSWDEKPILEIAETIGVPIGTVQAFARSHYLYFKYLGQPATKRK